jgi:nucleolar protein 4
LFSDIAPVRNAFVVLEHASGASKGVGYVSFAIKEDAELALTKVTKDGLKVDGRGIRVQWAENKPKQGDPPPNFIPTPTVKDNKPKDPVAIRSIVISGLPPSIDAKSLWKKIRKLDGAEKVDWPLTAVTGEEDPTSGMCSTLSSTKS